MTKSDVKVSVVMAVYNGEKYLKEAITSILQQSFGYFEFIIVNDGSSDKSLEIIESFKDNRIMLINQVNQGLSKALNCGIRASVGEYIARMDADDISCCDRLEKQIAFLDSHPEYVLIGSNATLIDKEGRLLYKTALPSTWDEIEKFLPANPIFHSSAVFRKKAWIEVGGYREEIRHHFEDKILWNQFARLGRLYNHPEPLICYRLVPESISNNTSEEIRLITEISNKIIETDTISDSDIERLNVLRTIDRRERFATYYFRLGTIFLDSNFDRKKALFNLFKSITWRPINIGVYLNILLCFLPKNTIKSLRDWRHQRTRE